MSRQRTIATALLVAWLVPAFLSGARNAQANGIGDLYASIDRGVLELHVASEKIVQRVDLAATPTGMAFSNDARSLYLAGGRARLDRVDIETIRLADNIGLDIDVVAVAVPEGNTAVAAGPGRSALLLADLIDGTVRETARLPGSPDLLVADRRDRHAMAARSGASWVAIVDIDDGSIAKIDLTGEVVGMAVDRAGDAGFVVTRSPDRLTRISLVDPAIEWEVPLPGPPTAVVSTSFGPIVAGTSALWASDGQTATAWATEGAPAGILATSDDGGLVYVGQPAAVLALDSGGELLRTIALLATDKLRGLVAFPALGSLAAGRGAGGEGPRIEPPATSTLPVWLTELADSPAHLAGGLVVFAGLLGLGTLLLRRRSERE